MCIYRYNWYTTVLHSNGKHILLPKVCLFGGDKNLENNMPPFLKKKWPQWEGKNLNMIMKKIIINIYLYLWILCQYYFFTQ